MCLDEEIMQLCVELDEKRKQQEKKKRESETDDLLENVYYNIKTAVM